MTDQEIVEIALKAKERAYAPYSGFRVGAALLAESGKVYDGVNIENASFGATNCAERTAIFKAVSMGDLKINTLAVASDSENFTYPCGICRQVILEFADQNTRILCSNKDGKYEAYTLSDLLPKAFDKLELKNSSK